MEELKGKKLLILGGNALTMDIVEKAKDLGVYTIVTDWNSIERSPAKRIADEYWNISLLDYDALIKNIKVSGVNGIITGFTDSYLSPYQHLCELNGFPCYATKKQFEWTLDKAKFKAKCKQYGVPVVTEYSLKDFNPKQITKTNRIIIKPVDNSGSRGICICDNPEDFQKMLTYSLEFSKKKQVVIERYMDCDDISFEYTIQDGEVTLSAICDRYIYRTKYAGSVTSKLIYPSKYLHEYLATTDEKVCRMFHEEGLQNGVLFMQAFAENGKFYFYEMGYRLSGGRHYIFTEKENKRNAAKELVRFALTGSMSSERLADKINPSFKDVCCQLSLLGKSERIARITGVDSIEAMPEDLEASYYYSEGDKIGKQGTTAQIFARIHITAESQGIIDKTVSRIKETLIVEDEKGNNIIIDNGSERREF